MLTSLEGYANRHEAKESEETYTQLQAKSMIRNLYRTYMCPLNGPVSLLLWQRWISLAAQQQLNSRSLNERLTDLLNFRSSQLPYTKPH